MSLFNNRESLVGDVDRFRDIGIGESGVDEVVVMIGKEDSALDALGDPLLMEHQRGIVRDSEVEQRGDARDAQIESVLVSGGNETFLELRSLLDQHLRRADALHLVDAGNSRGEGHGGKPIASRVRHTRNRVLKEILTAERGDVISVCECLAEANEVGFKAEIMIRARKIESEARADVVNYEDRSVFGAHFTHRLPETVGGEHVVHKITVHIGLGNNRRDLALVFFEDGFERVEVVPIDVNIVHNVLGNDTGVVDLLRPGRDAVVISLKENDLLAMRIRSRGHDREGGHVAAVLGKERPIGARDGINEQFGKVHHLGRGQSGTVADSSLRCRGGINVGIVISENVRTVRAHIINKTVAVEIPDVRALGFRGVEGERLNGCIAPFCGSEVSVDTRGNDLHRAGERFATFIVSISFSHNFTSRKIECNAVENTVNVIDL